MADRSQRTKTMVDKFVGTLTGNQAYPAEVIWSSFEVILANALGIDVDEVTPAAYLVGDLGVQLIDWLDIIVRLEMTFGLEIDRSELLPDDILTNDEYVKDGQVTFKGVRELEKRMPFADLSNFAKSPVATKFSECLTVSDYCRYISWKLRPE
jgi:acyl carrier protein